MRPLSVVTRSPRYDTVPCVGIISPATRLSIVVLPQPEGPTIETISPSRTETVMSRVATMAPVFNGERFADAAEGDDVLAAHVGRSQPADVDAG